jgi:type II secretory pathway component PulC
MRGDRSFHLALWILNGAIVLGAMGFVWHRDPFAVSLPPIPEPESFAGDAPPVPPPPAPARVREYARLWSGLEIPEKPKPVKPKQRNPKPVKPKPKWVFVLTGVIVRPDMPAAAFIRVKNGTDRAYFEGDYLGGWMLSRIEADGVTLRRGKEVARLQLRIPVSLVVGKRISPAAAFRFDGMAEGPDLGELGGAPSPRTAEGAAGGEDAFSWDEPASPPKTALAEAHPEAEPKEEDVFIPPPKDRQFTLKPHVMKFVRDRSQMLARQIRVSMSQSEGRYDGLSVDGVKPGSLWQKYGLAKGDVIRSVNGEPLDSPAAVMRWYQALFDPESAIDRLRLEVVRQGTTMERLFVLSGGGGGG